MKLKDRIRQALQQELEPLGFRYLKSTGDFKRSINKETNVYVYYIPDCFDRGITHVTLLAGAEYRDIEDIIYKLNNTTSAKCGHFKLSCRLHWLMPKEEESEILYDISFRNEDSEDKCREKIEKLLYWMNTYLLPYIEKLSHRESAIEATLLLDRRFLINQEFVVPVMYCVWKHDKKAALDYLEEKRLGHLKYVKPGEWGTLERMKNGETIPPKDRPFYAIAYEEYVESAKKCREWIEAQDY